MELSQKQETFCINYFQCGNATEAAKLAGYRPRYVATNTTKLLNNTNIKQRLGELNQQAKDAKIMDVVERKERLSEIARARLVDYQEAGMDGAGYISITKDSPNTAAIAQIESATKFDENGNTGTLFTKVKLHNPITAISELNKMERIYEEGTTVNIDNRKIEIIVNSENARLLTDKIVEGQGTEKE